MTKSHTIKLYHKTSFSAAHRYWDSSLSESDNINKFDKCTNIHGHNFELTVELEGSIDTDTGMLIDFNRIKDIIDLNIINDFDYSYLNESHEYFKDHLPTTENISAYFFSILEHKFPDIVSLLSVRISEDETLNSRFKKD